MEGNKTALREEDSVEGNKTVWMEEDSVEGNKTVWMEEDRETRQGELMQDNVEGS